MRNLVLMNEEERYIDIAEEVVAEVVMHTLDQVEGIGYAGGKKGMNQWLSRNKENLKNIELGAEAHFDVRILVPFGENIIDNGKKVQERLIEQFKAFFDVQTVSFDILVEGFNNLK
jgi:uncharacterized alkaline shock family protein YloU